MNKIFITLIGLLFLSSQVSAQDDKSTQAIIPGGLNVFVEGCWDCNFDSFKREVNYVNFMRDRQEADVMLLVTDQDVGGGGEKFTLYFEGKTERYWEMMDTLTIFSANDDTDREISDKLLASFKKGVRPFVMKSDIADQLTFSFEQKDIPGNELDEAIPEVDPWNSWVFSIGGRGNFSGETTYNNLSVSGRLSANRVTEKDKLNFSANFRYNESNFHFIEYDSLGDEISRETYTSLRRSQYGSINYIRTLTDHWSAAAVLNARANTFSNIDFSGSFRAGVEYNYFPYTESDRQSFTFSYKMGTKYNDYVDTTIYDKTNELLWQQSVSIDLSQKQNWGSLYLGFTYFSYLHDLNLYSISLNPNIDWNIIKGLTIGIGGYFSLVGDQITLPRKSIDIPSQFLRDRIVATNYNYFGYFSLRYSFGSKYNNVVNPRFNNSIY